MAAESVIVGCKLPNGLILQVGNETVRLNGRARYRIPLEGRVNRNTDVEYADGLTVVPKQFWDSWYGAHKDYPPVMKVDAQGRPKEPAVYASPNRNEAVAKAKDTESAKVGFEGLDPLKPAPKVEPADSILKVLAENNAKR